MSAQKQIDKKHTSRASRLSNSFYRFINSVADAGSDLISLTRNDNQQTDIETQCDELLSTLGEASGTAIARRILEMYERMSDEERLSFFNLLRHRYHLNYDEISFAVQDLIEEESNSKLAKFLQISEPSRQELFRRLNMAPNGTQFLIEMRSTLLDLLSEYPDLQPVAADLEHLFTSWFNRGFLKMRSINWDTPAVVLEKLIQYETVHEMRGWDDLRQRLASDRRCFAFFHSALPDDPLVFVEVALVNGISSEIEPIIAVERDEIDLSKINTAIFYSINNCLSGLRGISFGNFLIKQVVIELSQEFPNIKSFATLSPVPSFANWLKSFLKNDINSLSLPLAEKELLLSFEDGAWINDRELQTQLEPLLTQALAYYLSEIKRGQNPADPVARFHLRNGARLDRLNWLADLSKDRMQQSYGFMVNYIYEIPDIERNHESYVKEKKVVCSNQITQQSYKFSQILND